jgi:hypothetical protein
VPAGEAGRLLPARRPPRLLCSAPTRLALTADPLRSPCGYSPTSRVNKTLRRLPCVPTNTWNAECIGAVRPHLALPSVAMVRTGFVMHTLSAA